MNAEPADVPGVSVVLPVFRPDPGHFATALDSILAQTFRDFELVIVEADPSEATRGCLASRNDPRIRWFRHDGPAHVAIQHNRAVELARAPLIARADADDVCKPRRLETEVAFLGRHSDVDVVGSNLTVVDENGTVIGKRLYPLEHLKIVEAMRRFNPIANSTVMFRRTVVELCGGWRTTTELPAQDYEWYSRLARAGVRFANIDEPLVRYRIHGGSLKSTRLVATLRSTLEIKRRYWAGEFDLRDRMIYALEHLLLLLPPAWVMRLFLAIRYRGVRDGAHGTGRTDETTSS